MAIPTQKVDFQHASERVVLSIDAMGGDRGPSAVVNGMAKSAAKNPRISFIVHGNEKVLKPLISKKKILRDITTIHHVDDVIEMKEKPSKAIRKMNTSSMGATIQSVKNGEASVAVSCGNTGALMAMSMLTLKKAPKISRPAIAVFWPSRNPQKYNVLLDAGADIKADENDLLQYAIMGASYMRNALDIKNPRIGLLNVGTEEHKGAQHLQKAAELIAQAAQPGGFDYVGFVEGGDLPSSKVDVIVTDGFTGNIALKTGEGTASLMGDALKEAFAQTLLSRLGSLFAISALRRMKKRLDPRRANGGVFLGLNGTVVKSHGGADATGVSAAIKLAFRLAENGFADRLTARVATSIDQIK